MPRFTVQFWGTRGSVATPGPSTLRYGGNTPCVEVRCDSRIIVLDAGTGIRPLGRKLEKEGVRSIDLMITHGHMDHLQGFPFFNLIYQPDFDVHIYMPPQPQADISMPFFRLMEEPHFPVIFSDLPARIQFHLMNGRVVLGDVEVGSMPLNHPGGSTAYRIEYHGRSLVYLTDHEPWSRTRGAGPESEALDRQLVDFLRGTDLLIREAQYTEAEYEQHRGWGHSSFGDVLAEAARGGVRRVALFHHDPDHDDDFLEAQLAAIRDDPRASGIEVFLAREGETIELL